MLVRDELPIQMVVNTLDADGLQIRDWQTVLHTAFADLKSESVARRSAYLRWIAAAGIVSYKSILGTERGLSQRGWG